MLARCRYRWRCRAAANWLEFLISNSFDRIIIINFYLIAWVWRSIASLLNLVFQSKPKMKLNRLGKMANYLRSCSSPCFVHFWANVSRRRRWQVPFMCCAVVQHCGSHWALLKSQDWLTQHILSAQEQHTDRQQTATADELGDCTMSRDNRHQHHSLFLVCTSSCT